MTIESEEITLNDLASMVQRGFVEMGNKIDSLDDRLTTRIDSLEVKVDSLEGSMNSRFSSLQGQMDNICLNYVLQKKSQ